MAKAKVRDAGLEEVSVSPFHGEYICVGVAGGGRAGAGAAPAAAAGQAAASAGRRPGAFSQPARARPPLAPHATARATLGVAYAPTQVNLTLISNA